MKDIESILTGEKAVNLKVGIAEEDMQKLAIYLLAAIFLGVLAANFISKK